MANTSVQENSSAHLARGQQASSAFHKASQLAVELLTLMLAGSGQSVQKSTWTAMSSIQVPPRTTNRKLSLVWQQLRERQHAISPCLQIPCSYQVSGVLIVMS